MCIELSFADYLDFEFVHLSLNVIQWYDNGIIDLNDRLLIFNLCFLLRRISLRMKPLLENHSQTVFPLFINNEKRNVLENENKSP